MVFLVLLLHVMLASNQEVLGKAFNLNNPNPFGGGGNQLPPGGNTLGGLPGLKPLQPVPLTPIKPLEPVKKVPIQKPKKSLKELKKEAMRTLAEVNTAHEFLSKFSAQPGFEVTQANIGGKQAFMHIQKSLDGKTEVTQMSLASPTGDCSPRPKPKDLFYMYAQHPNGMLWPTCITYNQCGGCCRSQVKECVATVSLNQTKTIFVLDPKDYTYKYVPVSYQEHIRCECQCKVQKHHCAANQVYDKHNCECTCPKTAEIKCPTLKQWSFVYCKCMCLKQKSDCGHYKVWDDDKCDCKCKETTTCASFQTWDDGSCRCVDQFGRV